MTSKADVEGFVGRPKLALIGLSRGGAKFSNSTRGELEAKGYTVYGVNPAGGEVGGKPLYTSLAELPEKVEAALVMVRPEHASAAARDCVANGIRWVWFQQGSQSEEAVRICREAGLNVVAGECILMYAGNSGFHNFHRFFKELFGGKLR